ncbi:MAG: AzlC family ABC transporter permease [Actinomycetota bacterium]
MSISWNRQASRDAVRGLVPLTPPVPLFGLVFGLAVAESDVVGPVAGWASSFLIFGGASQLAGVVVLDAGSSVAVAIGTILVINARHLMYSAALRSRFRDTPRWFRVLGPYTLVDQLFAITEPRPDDDPLDYKLSHYLTGGLYWVVWWVVAVGIGVIVGLTLGDVIPESWSLEFSVPLLFLGLLVNAIRDRPGLLAAAVSAVVAVLVIGLEPPGVGLLVAAVAGLVAGSAMGAIDGDDGADGDGHAAGGGGDDGGHDGAVDGTGSETGRGSGDDGGPTNGATSGVDGESEVDDAIDRQAEEDR